MEFFKIRRDIPFMRHALAFNVISLVTFLLAVGFLALRGLNFSIEFTGGTVLEVSEGRLPMTPYRHQAPGDRHLRSPRVPLFREIRILPMKIGSEVTDSETGRIGINAGPFKLHQLPQALAH